MSQAKQSKIEFEAWEYILPALPMIAEVSAKGFAKYGPGELGAGREKGQHQPRASASLLIQRQDRGRPAAGGGGKREPPSACVRKADDGDSKGGDA